MSNRKQRLELTWVGVGKENRPRLEPPRILLEGKLEQKTDTILLFTIRWILY